MTDPARETEKMYTDTGNPNRDRSHLLEVPPTQVDENADGASEKTDLDSEPE